MNLFERLKSDWIYLSKLYEIINATKDVTPDSDVLVGDVIEQQVDKHADRTFIVFDGETITYRQFDARANRFARWGQGIGLKPGDCVALFMENRPDYIAFWAGMAKIAVRTALINSNLSGAGLAHCVKVADARALVMNAELGPALESARSLLTLDAGIWHLGDPEGAPGSQSLEIALGDVSEERPDKSARAGHKAGEVALYIYTSGTTGLPKAAKITNVRAQGLMAAFWKAVGVNEDDRVLLTLPLYHATGGMCGVGSALYAGATLILRRKFSASHFWQEAIDNRATMMVYIGELGRYLMNQPPSPQERAHSIVKGFGNGLRADVWTEFVERTGIRHLVEFYGSTEGNVSFFNVDGKIGAVGRIPPILKGILKARFVRFDIEKEEPVRGPDGLCIEAKPNEPGEAIGPISDAPRQRFDGYEDESQTKKKILRDAFVKGDMWFRTGDLMRKDKDGYVYFVDRIGDTFRWKSENVSTGEVEIAISSFPGVEHAIVYGVKVPGQDGRAGMAAIGSRGSIDLKALYAHLGRTLPSYARPVFVRFQQEAETTGTLKYRKVDLVAAGFDPGKTGDPLFVADAAQGTYVPIDATMFEQLMGGAMRL
ncbi:MAG: long-chain-acyl-CoA synthetase [Alphaproteobacteria bacterium]|nr:long-chain-acyl-CoA synthetase [Alphaproteobacteria bacterium]